MGVQKVETRLQPRNACTGPPRVGLTVTRELAPNQRVTTLIMEPEPAGVLVHGASGVAPASSRLNQQEVP